MEVRGGHGAEQQPGGTAETAGTHNQQVSVLGRMQASCGRVSLDNSPGHRHALAVHALQGLALEPACDLWEDVKVPDHAYHTDGDGRELPRGDSPRLARALPGLGDGPFQGKARRGRTVHPATTLTAPSPLMSAALRQALHLLPSVWSPTRFCAQDRTS